jgi:hypothetical protein
VLWPGFLHTPMHCQGNNCIPPEHLLLCGQMALSKEAREFFVNEGRKGGKIAARKMTKEQRGEKMRRAAQAR